MNERMHSVASGAERSAAQRSTARTRDTCTTDTQCTRVMCSCVVVSRAPHCVHAACRCRFLTGECPLALVQVLGVCPQSQRVPVVWSFSNLADVSLWTRLRCSSRRTPPMRLGSRRCRATSWPRTLLSMAISFSLSTSRLCLAVLGLLRLQLRQESVSTLGAARARQRIHVLASVS